MHHWRGGLDLRELADSGCARAWKALFLDPSDAHRERDAHRASGRGRSVAEHRSPCRVAIRYSVAESIRRLLGRVSRDLFTSGAAWPCSLVRNSLQPHERGLVVTLRVSLRSGLRAFCTVRGSIWLDRPDRSCWLGIQLC